MRDILRSEGAELRERASAVEGKLHQARGTGALAAHCAGLRACSCAAARQVELDSIQDYVAESDNLVALQVQIRGCDGILGKMESLLGGFQSDLGKISSEARRSGGALRQSRPRALLRRGARRQIKTLQEQSFTMSIKLRNRKTAEAQLGQFVEDLSLPPKLISAIVDGEVGLRHRGGGQLAACPPRHSRARVPRR